MLPDHREPRPCMLRSDLMPRATDRELTGGRAAQRSAARSSGRSGTGAGGPLPMGRTPTARRRSLISGPGRCDAKHRSAGRRFALTYAFSSGYRARSRSAGNERSGTASYDNRELPTSNWKCLSRRLRNPVDVLPRVVFSVDNCPDDGVVFNALSGESAHARAAVRH